MQVQSNVIQATYFVGREPLGEWRSFRIYDSSNRITEIAADFVRARDTVRAILARKKTGKKLNAFDQFMFALAWSRICELRDEVSARLIAMLDVYEDIPTSLVVAVDEPDRSFRFARGDEIDVIRYAFGEAKRRQILVLRPSTLLREAVGVLSQVT